MGPLIAETHCVQDVLLWCGVCASVVQFASDRIAGALVKGYDFSAQSMSELGASGSPVRSLVIGMTLVASVLMAAFGVGIWQAGGLAVMPRIVASLIVVNAALTLIATVVFPPRFGVRPAFTAPGVLLMFFGVLSFVFAMILGAFAFGGWMRIISIAVPATYVVLAVLRFATAVSSAQTRVMIGTQERTMALGFLLWMVALATYLLSSGGRVRV